MTYAEAVAYLDSLAQFGWKLDLARIERLCELAGHPERNFPSVLVAGSAGKGSTCAFLASILQAAGLRVGLAPKPHLHTHRERVQVDGELISEERFAALMARIVPLAAQVTREEGAPTVFEVMTLLSFLHFAEERVDRAVIEVGLGGRFDATNVLPADLSLITMIGLDHTDRLGDTVEQIAFEKAGIIKPGQRLVTGATGGALQVIERIAAERHNQIRRLHHEIRIANLHPEATGTTLDLTILEPAPAPVPPSSSTTDHGTVGIGPRADPPPTDPAPVRPIGSTHKHDAVGSARRSVPPPPAMHPFGQSPGTTAPTPPPGPPSALIPHPSSFQGLRLTMVGEHQAHNAALAAAAALWLRDRHPQLNEEAIRRGLALTQVPGRLQVLQTVPLVLADAAHSPDRAAALAHALQTLYLPQHPHRRLILVLGCSTGHAPEVVVDRLAPLAAEVIATRSRHPAAVPASEIAAAARSARVPTREIEPVSAALAEALTLARPEDLVLITGSLFVVGEATEP